MAVTTAVVNVYCVQYNLQPPSDPVVVFVFNPTVVTALTAAPLNTTYTVVFNLVSNMPGATLAAETSVSGTPSDLVVTGSGSTCLILTFTNAGSTGAFNYTLSVTANGTTYVSDDPEIEIPPPT